jgi:hypothetical protein
MRGPRLRGASAGAGSAGTATIDDVAAAGAGEFSGAGAADRSRFEERLVPVRGSSITWR